MEKTLSSLSVEYDWEDICVIEDRVSFNATSLHQDAAVYRFLFSKDGRQWKTYIGETSALRKRMQHYARSLKKVPEVPFKAPVRQGSRKVAIHIARQIGADGVVALQEMRLKTLQLGSDYWQLKNPFARLLLENLAILEAERAGVKVINFDRQLNRIKLNLRKLNAT